jgi:hypothetical protein
MLKAKIPNNFQVLVETGGAAKWCTSSPVPNINKNKIQRWQIINSKMKLLSDENAANMSDESTLSSFLEWGLTKAKDANSEHIASILWDHGGGWSGVCHDNSSANASEPKLYLTLEDIHNAFNESLINQNAYSQFDIIGFDACLMSELEVYGSIHDYAKYIIGSEETEPGYGWEYERLINKTVSQSDNPHNVALQW